MRQIFSKSFSLFFSIICRSSSSYQPEFRLFLRASLSLSSCSLVFRHLSTSLPLTPDEFSTSPHFVFSFGNLTLLGIDTRHAISHWHYACGENHTQATVTTNPTETRRTSWEDRQDHTLETRPTARFYSFTVDLNRSGHWSPDGNGSGYKMNNVGFVLHRSRKRKKAIFVT